MIVARSFGWSAVSDEPMDWTDYHLARQLLAEEKVGTRTRQAEADEDGAFAAAKNLIPRG